MGVIRPSRARNVDIGKGVRSVRTTQKIEDFCGFRWACGHCGQDFAFQTFTRTREAQMTSLNARQLPEKETAMSITDGKWPKCDCPDCVDYPDFSDDGGPREVPDDDPRAALDECSRRGCTARGDPWVDEGWAWWWRKYLWLEEGFFCPEHDAMIRHGHEIGAFDDWPLDTNPEVLERLEEMANFVDINSPGGQAILEEMERSFDD
jgi:hypothetical protein